MEFDYPKGATPLSQNQADDLIPTHITTREELNIWEQQNIYEATEWLKKTKPKDILNEAFVKKLHKKMFGNVWRWAGKFRLKELRRSPSASFRACPVRLRSGQALSLSKG